MRNFTLLVASFFLVGNMASASENPVFSDNTGKGPKHAIDYRDAEPISFMERGIEFYVFPNGEFDFNTRPQDSEGDDFYFKAAGKRSTVTVSRGPVNYGVRIEHDSFGRVRRVGNTFINYDSRDRVSRIGTVYMRYNSFAISQIGGLRIVYNRKCQIIDIVGSVKGRYAGHYYNNNDYNNDYGYTNGSEDYDDDSYYYYKADGTKAKIEDAAEGTRK
ncbi:hypothetical protein [Flavobacterium humi]|uniref:Uncharacterized protein n=1 Tax=Flavobacterium humi TaxID=2562683 RepID=A0A4Z0L990_9FLAO|nr:hypothetical protein [Flavobacterium humi]TGD58859.1 hypothetical protein E4635_03125 [Flavobacterium humi]